MEQEIKKYDNDFNIGIFINKVDRIFIMLLDALMERNIDNIKHYISDSIYEHFSNLAKQYEQKNIIRVFDEMNVKSTNIECYEIKDNNIYITVNLVSRYMDYFIDANNGNYISGINNQRIEINHKIIFAKKLYTKDIGVSIKCPTCGNSMNINNSGICDFCKNIIDMSDYDYIITKIDI